MKCPPHIDVWTMTTGAAIGATARQTREVRGVRGTVEVGASQPCTVNLLGALGAVIDSGTVGAAGGAVILSFTAPPSRVTVEAINTLAAAGAYTCILSQSREFDPCDSSRA